MRSRTNRRGDMSAFRPILLLAVTVFIDLLGFGIVLPNLPQYIEGAVGPNHAHAALIGTLLAASYSFTQFLCAPAWGRYSDRAGRRPVILISLLGIGLAYLFFGFAAGRLWMLFAARILAGLLSSASIGVAFAYVADVTTPEKRAQGIGLLGACFGLGFMLGPALGGLLGHISLPLPAFVAAGMALINWVFTLRFLPESLSKEERERAARGETGTPEPMLSLLSRVVQGPAGFLFILTFLVTFGFAAMEQIFSFYLLAHKSFGVTRESQPLVTGCILGGAGLVSIFIQGGLIGRIVARYGEGLTARVGIFLLAFGFATFTIPNSLYSLALGPMMLLFIGRAMVAPALSALVSRKANLGQGLTLSTSQSFDALARTVGPLTAGAVFQYISPGAPYILSAVVMASAFALAYTYREQMIVPKQPPTGGSGVEQEAVPDEGFVPAPAKPVKAGR